VITPQVRARAAVDAMARNDRDRAADLIAGWITSQTTGGQAYEFLKAAAMIAVRAMRSTARPFASHPRIVWVPKIGDGDNSPKAWAMRFTNAFMNQDEPMAHALFGSEFEAFLAAPDERGTRMAECLAGVLWTAAMAEKSVVL
jgi:hypothetical protein